jgi:flagellar biosynthesis protein FliP
MAPAAAQDISVNFGQGNGLTERVIQMIALLTVLSLAPSILVMMTSFTRIVVVLSLLRTALGTATAPPNAVIVSLALFLTAFVMGPALQRAMTRASSRSWPMKSPPSRPSNAAHSRCARSCKRAGSLIQSYGGG